jgi:hypothetical protein
MAGDDRKTELELPRDIARWTREAALPIVRPRVAALLETDSKKRTYAAMDGATGVIAIEKATGANHNDIAKWLKVWVAEGIVDAGSNPPRATFTLSELGIEPPPPKAARKPAAKAAAR